MEQIRIAGDRLETDRLILRGWEEEDAEALFEYAKNPNVGKTAGWEAHKSVEESLEIIRQFREADCVFAVVWKETGRAIGSVGMHRTEESERFAKRYGRTAEIGYVLSEEYWGRGIMTEAVKEVLRYGFIRQGLRLWVAEVFDGNDASQRILEKLGFGEPMRLSAFAEHEGETRPGLWFLLHREC